MRGLRTVLCGMALCLCANAQRQTAAPAGIPVPAPAATRLAAVKATPQSMHFRVRVIDGRNGMAIQNAHVKLWYDEPTGPGYQFTTDPQGYGNMPAPVGEPVRVLAALTDYAECRRLQRDDPPVGYNLQSIAATGITAQNTCGRFAVRTSPGELVLFARPGRWYENINRSPGN